MRSFLSLTILACCAASFGADVRPVGVYRLVPSAQTRQFCAHHRLPLPQGTLTLRQDRVFDLLVTDDTGTSRTRGGYSVRGEVVTFSVEVGKGAGLPSAMRFSTNGLQAGDAVFSRVRASAPVVKVVAAPKSLTAPAAPDLVVEQPTGTPIRGTWTLHRAGGEDRSTKFIFGADGSFRFVGQNSSSKGRYNCAENGIELVWSEVDGVPLERGVNMRKTLPWAEYGTAFRVDTYRYERAER